jgi:hypothetical protein
MMRELRDNVKEQENTLEEGHSYVVHADTDAKALQEMMHDRMSSSGILRWR